MRVEIAIYMENMVSAQIIIAVFPEIKIGIYSNHISTWDRLFRIKES